MHWENLKEIMHKLECNTNFLLQVCATLGTTPMCAFDNITEIGPICKFDNLRPYTHFLGLNFSCGMGLNILINSTQRS